MVTRPETKLKPLCFLAEDQPSATPQGRFRRTSGSAGTLAATARSDQRGTSVPTNMPPRPLATTADGVGGHPLLPLRALPPGRGAQRPRPARRRRRRAHHRRRLARRQRRGRRGDGRRRPPDPGDPPRREQGPHRHLQRGPRDRRGRLRRAALGRRHAHPGLARSGHRADGGQPVGRDGLRPPARLRRRAAAGDHRGAQLVGLGRPRVDRAALPAGQQLHLQPRGRACAATCSGPSAATTRRSPTPATSRCGCGPPRSPTSVGSTAPTRATTGSTRPACSAPSSPASSPTSRVGATRSTSVLNGPGERVRARRGRAALRAGPAGHRHHRPRAGVRAAYDDGSTDDRAGRRLRRVRPRRSTPTPATAAGVAGARPAPSTPARSAATAASRAPAGERVRDLEGRIRWRRWRRSGV